jgi:hypothetical protein
MGPTLDPSGKAAPLACMNSGQKAGTISMNSPRLGVPQAAILPGLSYHAPACADASKNIP